MKSAIQSFKETRMYYENKSNQELAKIFTEIDESINDGLFSVAGIGSLSDNALFVLRELGYDAQNDTFRESNYYWINWMTIDACTKKLDEKILKICRENDEQITQIKN